MITTNRIPLLKRTRYKTVVNYDLKNKKYGSLVIVNTMDIKDLKNKFGNVLIDYNSLFNQIYMKRREQIKIGNKNIVKNRLNEREAYYTNVEKELPFVNGINEGRLSMGYNLIVELSYANTLFSESTEMITKIKKPVVYWDFISRYLSDLPLNNYKYKTMIISADEFSNTIVRDMSGNNDTINPISYLYLLLKRNIEEFYKLGDIDILITSSTGGVIRINPVECRKLNNDEGNKNIASIFRRELFKLINKQDPEDGNIVSNVDLLSNRSDNLSKNISNNIISRYIYGATGDENIPEEVKEKIEKEIEKTIDNISKNGIEVTEDTVNREIDKNEELIKDIVKSTTNKPMKLSTASTKRDELLREKQLELNIKGKTLEEVLSVKSEDIKIPVNDVSNKTETINGNMTDVRFPNINKAYVEELMEKDLVSMFTDMNNKSLKVFVRSISSEDTSDLSNYKETYTIELEDELRVRHRLTFDVPKVIDGKFLYLGGNRKYINNQQLLLPIVKVEPDTVQLVSNYNKIFIRRYGEKVSLKNEKLKKALSENIDNVRVKRGRYDLENKGFVTTIDYDDLSKIFKEINIKGTRIVFDQKSIRQQMLDIGIKGLEEKLDKELLPLGIEKNKYYCVDLSTDEVVMINLDGKTMSTDMNMVDFMLSLSPELEAMVGNQSAGKKYMYSRATIMTKQVPIVLLLSYFEGINGFLKRANIKHYFSDTRPRISSDESVIQFEDGYLVYSHSSTAVSLLMNGFVDIPTKNYKFEDFEDKLMYQSLFETMFGRRNIANAFDNFLDNFIDPMTMDVLRRLSLPTDLTGMVLYANELLADNQFTHEATVSRIRCAEVINAIVYKNVAKAYEKYKETSTYANPVKISIKKDAILKEVMMQQIVEDYSELNPVSEQQKMRGCLRKGPSGCNLAQAYTEEQRSYHPAMTGIFTLSSSPDGNVGKVLPPIEVILYGKLS